MLIKAINRLKRRAEAAPAEPASPPPPSREEQLLAEIRDLLKHQS
jgi:large conductance mechanosensitive channel